MKKAVAKKKTQKFPTKAAKVVKKPAAKVISQQPAQGAMQPRGPQGRPDMPLAETSQPQQLM